MGSTLNDLHQILTGDNKDGVKAGASGAQGAGGSKRKAPGLSQLSDAAEKIEVNPGHDAPTNPPIPVFASQGLSQEQLLDVVQPMHFQQPSQPDIGPPNLPQSQSQQGQPGDDAAKVVLPVTMGLNMDNAMMSQLLNPGLLQSGLPLNLELMNGINGWNNFYGTPEEPTPGSGGGNRSKGKKQTRRGPMDEMRQLIRIMVKIFPQSINLIGNTEEAGGGNRISEEQIKSYLDRVVGDAPRPSWGVPNGWNGYLAEVFSWATGKVVTGDEASRVAKREPGRSWEALEDAMEALGVHPHAWPLPLTIAGISEAEKNPTPLPVPAVPLKRGGGGGGGGGGGNDSAPPTTTTSSRRTRAPTQNDYNKMDESSVWKIINDALNAAVAKNGQGADQAAVAVAKATARHRMDEISGAMPFQYLPGFGIDGNVNNILMMAAQGTLPMGVGGAMQLDPNDPNTMAMIAAAAAAAGIPGMQMMEQAAPVASGEERGAKRQRKDGEGTPSTEEDDARAPGGDPRSNLLNALDQTGAGGGGGDSAKGAQLGSLPMQAPPLNMSSYANIAHIAIPDLNLGLNVQGAGGAGGEGAPAAPAEDQAAGDGK